MKKPVILAIAIAIIGVIAMNMTLSAQSGKLSDMTLSEMVAQAADGDEDNPDHEQMDACTLCGNCTFAPNKQLDSRLCMNGGTHKKCVKNPQCCCNPADGTDCGEIFGKDDD